MLKYVAFALACMILGALVTLAAAGLAEISKPPVPYLEPGASSYERKGMPLPPWLRRKYRA